MSRCLFVVAIADGPGAFLAKTVKADSAQQAICGLLAFAGTDPAFVARVARAKEDWATVLGQEGIAFCAVEVDNVHDFRSSDQ